LQLNRTRYYQATVGRWTSIDPLGHRAGDPNFYRYVGNMPQMAVDPSGLRAITLNDLNLSIADMEALIAERLAEGTPLSALELAIILKIYQREISKGLYAKHPAIIALLKDFYSLQLQGIRNDVVAKWSRRLRTLTWILGDPLTVGCLEQAIRKKIDELDSDSFEVRVKARAYIRSLGILGYYYLLIPNLSVEQNHFRELFLDELWKLFQAETLLEILDQLDKQDRKDLLEAIANSPDEYPAYWVNLAKQLLDSMK
jgi:hypothetical protein